MEESDSFSLRAAIHRECTGKPPELRIIEGCIILSPGLEHRVTDHRIKESCLNADACDQCRALSVEPVREAAVRGN